jgi:hypothetical protein
MATVPAIEEGEVDVDTRAGLSNQIDVEWTFASEHNDGSDLFALPLLALRFAPNLDGHNAASAGKFASLRSTVTDPDGNTERQTIIRACALR